VLAWWVLVWLSGCWGWWVLVWCGCQPAVFWWVGEWVQCCASMPQSTSCAARVPCLRCRPFLATVPPLFPLGTAPIWWYCRILTRRSPRAPPPASGTSCSSAFRRYCVCSLTVLLIAQQIVLSPLQAVLSRTAYTRLCQSSRGEHRRQLCRCARHCFRSPLCHSALCRCPGLFVDAQTRTNKQT
jgi:hypothetical protein